MHKMECVAMCTYGENWCPSETVRLVARIILKQVKFFVPCRNNFIQARGLNKTFTDTIVQINSVWYDRCFYGQQKWWRSQLRFILQKVTTEQTPSERLLLLKEFESRKCEWQWARRVTFQSDGSVVTFHSVCVVVEAVVINILCCGLQSCKALRHMGAVISCDFLFSSFFKALC